MRQPAPRVRAFAIFLGVGLTGLSAQAQPFASGETPSSLVAQGIVREVFQSPRQGGTDYVVELRVQSVDLGSNRPAGARIVVPNAGESIFVVVSRSDRQQSSPIPTERAQIRAYLNPRDSGGWVPAATAWYEQTSRDLAAAQPDDPAPSAAGAAPAPSGAETVLNAFGIQVESIDVGGRNLLRVARVLEGTPAQKAGLEAGDVLIQAQGKVITGPEDLVSVVSAARGPIELRVLNVRNGQTVAIQADLTGMNTTAAAPADPRMPAPAPIPTTPASADGRVNRLGITVRPVTDGLQIVSVDPGSAGQKAGLELEDIIRGGGDPRSGKVSELTEVKALDQAVNQAGDQIVLVVTDHRSGKSVPVPVPLNGAAGSATPPGGRMPTPAPSSSQATTPAPSSSGGGSSSGLSRLGIAVEQVSVKFVPALKVTQLTPGGPAQRAGIEVGDLITGADGTALIQASDLEAVLAKAGSKVTLSVTDGKGGRKAQVDVPLGR